MMADKASPTLRAIETIMDLKNENEFLKISNQRLLSENEKLRDFIATAAHELRNPICPILGSIEVIEEKVGNKKEDIRDEMVRIVRNAKRLQKVACDILELNIIENGGNVRLHLNEVEITSLISTVIEDVQSKHVAKTKNLQIIFQPNHDMIIVRCDTLKISQVLFNLFDNAIKFTQYGNIVCSLHISNSYLTVTITDTGNGIDPTIENNLFEKYTSTSQNGTGLGLYLSKKIVEAHGGRVWAENNSAGRGATFTFSIPAYFA